MRLSAKRFPIAGVLRGCEVWENVLDGGLKFEAILVSAGGYSYVVMKGVTK